MPQELRSATRPGSWDDLYATFFRALVVAGLVVALLTLWRIREALLLLFASVVLAVILRAAARRVQGWTGLSGTWALTVVALVALVVLVLLGWLVGAQLQSQVATLTQRLPQAVRSLEESLGLSLFGGQGGQGGAASVMGNLEGLLGQAASITRAAASALSGLVLVVVGAFFLAADPEIYRRGLVKMFPPRRHREVEETLDDCGNALLLWLVAQLIAMAIVACLVTLGTWLIGLPAPLGLGLYAGLVEFVPIVGPVIGAIPAALLALAEGGSAVIWTLLLFLGIQQVESNIIMPVVQRRMVETPPALLLFALLAIGLVFGVAGVLIAAPLTVVLYVLVKKLYIRETLGEETSVPGEERGPS